MHPRPPDRMLREEDLDAVRYVLYKDGTTLGLVVRATLGAEGGERWRFEAIRA